MKNGAVKNSPILYDACRHDHLQRRTGVRYPHFAAENLDAALASYRFVVGFAAPLSLRRSVAHHSPACKMINAPLPFRLIGLFFQLHSIIYFIIYFIFVRNMHPDRAF